MQLNHQNKLHQWGAIPKNENSSTISNTLNNSSNNNNNNNPVSPNTELQVATHIRNGHKILVILRGAPGSGKSTLARRLVEDNVTLGRLYGVEHFVFSTDDYFYDSNGRYKFDMQRLSDAHTYNQRRSKAKMSTGWSPIIIDNTNMQIWEMLPYVEPAVRHSYVVAVLEPQTSWRAAAGLLAQRNQHKVPVDKIRRMLSKYEYSTADDLIKSLKYARYTQPLPQMRLQPPVMITMQEDKTAIKSQQKVQNITNHSADSTLSKPSVHAWKSVFPQDKPITPVNAEASKPSLLDLLKEGISEVQSTVTDTQSPKTNASSMPKRTTYQRHSINCRNEHASFASLRQIYPNKQVDELWDLFEKCSGNIDWAIDLLLKEDELKVAGNKLAASFHETEEAKLDEFKCACDTDTLVVDALVLPKSQPVQLASSKPQRQRIRAPRQQAASLLDISYNFNDNRGALASRPKVNNIHVAAPTKTVTMEIGVQTDQCDDEENGTHELIEVSLGRTLVRQLTDAFKIETETRLQEDVSTVQRTNVFIPRALAGELYMLWLEAVYNQLEEQRIKSLKEDEEFARLLKIPKYEHYMESPTNTSELLDMETARALVKADEEQEQQQREDERTDLATHLTQMKLCEEFPDIPRETLLDVLAANDNSYKQAMTMLQETKTSWTTEATDFDMVDVPQIKEFLPISNTDSRDGKCAIPLDEAKRLALIDFEEMRNKAAHHSQLKAECYRKAKESVQKGNGTVALYYSQVAEFHKLKIDQYNHRAANSIVEVHKRTQNNANLLDLHYLHVIEAICCLDIFLDGHITELRSLARPYKHIFIITGRGLHSIGGVSSIKNKVKMRLKERNLRWVEVNPGLLKVKIFSASRHSRNI